MPYSMFHVFGVGLKVSINKNAVDVTLGLGSRSEVNNLLN